MSTNYRLRCGACQEQGGFFSRQAWGWGNSDIIENTVFLMAHADCYDKYQGEEDARFEILSEYDWTPSRDGEELAWIENLQNPDTVAGSAFPRADEWEVPNENIRLWWDIYKQDLTHEANQIRARMTEKTMREKERRELREKLEQQFQEDMENRIKTCVAGGGHHWDIDELYLQDGNKMQSLGSAKICKTCGLTGSGAVII